jgi:hypothetical protein
MTEPPLAKLQRMFPVVVLRATQAGEVVRAPLARFEPVVGAELQTTRSPRNWNMYFGLRKVGGSDRTRTRGLLRDREAF